MEVRFAHARARRLKVVIIPEDRKLNVKFRKKESHAESTANPYNSADLILCAEHLMWPWRHDGKSMTSCRNAASVEG
jgi:hypothetical protein